MNLNATLLGEALLLFAIIMAVSCYFLGKKKTGRPIFTGFIGFALAFIPPLALVFCAVLLFKKDLSTNS